MNAKLTARNVAALQLPTGKNDLIMFDADLPGFGYRLRRGSGDTINRSWVAQYRRGGGTRRVLLGSAAVLSAEQARIAAKKILATAVLGGDPQADRADRRSKDQVSFGGVIAEYLTAKKPDLRPRSYVEIERFLTGYYFKPLHPYPVDTVARKDIASRLLVITRESGSVAAARARTALNSFFAWAVGAGLRDHNPVTGSIKPKNSKPRERVLSNDELAAVWRACGDDDFGRIIKLLILSGGRRSEVGGLRWSELNETTGEWTIPGERTKNKCEHTLFLPAAFWEIVKSVPRRVNRDHLFGHYGLRGVGFSHWMLKDDLDERLGDKVKPWVVHDIRRTVATRMNDIGVQPHIVEQILNHKKKGIAGVYNRSVYKKEVKAALILWADHIRTLVDGGERVIVPFATP